MPHKERKGQVGTRGEGGEDRSGGKKGTEDQCSMRGGRVNSACGKREGRIGALRYRVKSACGERGERIGMRGEGGEDRSTEIQGQVGHAWRGKRESAQRNGRQGQIGLYEEGRKDRRDGKRGTA